MKKVLLFILICLPFCFFGCAKQNVVKLETPKNLSVENGNIRFERVKDEQFYLIEINTLQILADINNSHVEIYSENGVNYFEFDASNLLTVGEDYAIKVQACAKGKKSSDFVALNYTYTHHSKLNIPTNLKIVNDVLTWDAVEGAQFYRVEITTPKRHVETLNVSQNLFNLKSTLNDAGKYTFKVMAQTNDNNFSSSDVAVKECEHFVNLNTPSGLEIDEQSLILSAQVDERANAVEIKINNEQFVVEKQVDGLEIEGQTWKFNLKNLVSHFSHSIDFTVLGNYQIKLKAEFVTNTKNYYNSSAFSASVNYVSTKKLNAPKAEIVEKGAQKIVQFSSGEIEHVSGFLLEVNFGGSSQQFVFDASVTSFVLPENFVSVSVTALGKGFYLNSTATTVLK